MKYFQYTNTIRDLDGKLRPPEDYEALLAYENEVRVGHVYVTSDKLYIALEIKSEERKRLQKRV